MTLKRNVFLGALWLVGARLSTRLLDLISMLVMARLLMPSDFGLVALALSVVTILNAVTDLSLSSAIVQMASPQKSTYDTAFTLGAMRGVISFIVVAAMAWPMAIVYGDSRLFGVVSAMALAPFFQGFRSPLMAVFERELKFSPVFFTETLSKVCATSIALLLAIIFRSYWALVSGVILSQIIPLMLSYYFAPYWPTFSLRDWRTIFAFSSWMTLANLVNTINFQSDRFFIGGKLGTSLLGQYTVGSELASLPTNAPLMPIMQSLYSAFAKVSGDLGKLRAGYLASQNVLIAIALPVAMSVSILAYPIVIISVGRNWAPAAYVVQVLAPVFAFQILVAPAQSVAMALGATRGIFIRDVIGICVRLPLILLAVSFGGFREVVWARVFSGLFFVVPNLLMMKKLLGVSIADQLLSSWRSYLSVLVLSSAIYLPSNYFSLLERTDLAALPYLALLELFGCATYLLVHYSLWSIKKPPNSVEARALSLVKMVIAKLRQGIVK